MDHLARCADGALVLQLISLVPLSTIRHAHYTPKASWALQSCTA